MTLVPSDPLVAGGATRRFDHDAVSIAYTVAGEGPVVLYAHGLTASRATNARLGLSDFAQVSRVAQLVAYDARGHGESSGTPSSADYLWPALAKDLLALLDHVSASAPVSAIGLSMGTATLLYAALERPERFDRLVLTAPPTAWATRAAQCEMYEKLARWIETHEPARVAEYFSRAPVAPIFRDVPDYAHGPDVPLALLPTVLRGAGQSDLPAPERLRTLGHKTLILAWDTDATHPVSTATALAELLPNAQLHISTTSDDVRSWGARIAQFLSEP